MRPSRRLLSALSALMVSVCLTAALAQDESPPPEIPREIMTAQSLTAADEQVIQRYIDYYVKQLVGEPAQAAPDGQAVALNPDNDGASVALMIDRRAAKAREMLVDKLTVLGSSAVFKITYSTRLSIALKQANALDPNRRVSIRLNTLIIVTDLIDVGAADVIVRGLEDKSAACRYWAAIAVGRFSKTAEFLKEANEPLRQKLLAAAGVALNSETVLRVQEQLVDALVSMGSLQAVESILAWMNQRIRHIAVAEESMSLAPDLAGIRRIFLAQLLPGGVRLPPAVRKELGRVAFRYLSLSIAILQKRAPKDAMINDEYRNMILECDKVLTHVVVGQLSPGAKLPPPIAREDLFGPNANLTKVALKIEEWRELLIADSKVGLKPAELKVLLREEGAVEETPGSKPAELAPRPSLIEPERPAQDAPPAPAPTPEPAPAPAPNNK